MMPMIDVTVTVFSASRSSSIAMLLHMESETVKPPKALINMSRKVMPAFVVATKLSQGEKDLEDPY